ncbi:hypothetical protein RSAG8_08241, partial [Rhizoctonia solani AG-8 WAC10335]
MSLSGEESDEQLVRVIRENKQLSRSIRTLQEDNQQKDRELNRLSEQIAELQRNRDESGNRGPHGSSAAQNGKTAQEEWATHANAAGRRAAVLHMPFMEDDFLIGHQVQAALPTIISDVKKAAKADDDEGEDPEDMLPPERDPRLYWAEYCFGVPAPVDMVREILFHMPANAGKYWNKPWFQQSFKEGRRRVRTEIAYDVAQNYNTIFEFTDKRFLDKANRVEMPEVQELRNTFQYTFNEVTHKPDIRTFYRHPCILRVLRLVFHGPSAITNGRRSAKARSSRANGWHVREVSPPMLAFAATVIDFVLSGEASFEASSEYSNYKEFFHGRLALMESFFDAHPEEFEDLLGHYNHSLFPSYHPMEDQLSDDGGQAAPQGEVHSGLNQADIMFIENL